MEMHLLYIMEANFILLLLWATNAYLAVATDHCAPSPRAIATPLEHPMCPDPILFENQTVFEDFRDWTPWTHKPYCLGSGQEPVCVFTNAMLPLGLNQGISIITTPSSSARELNLLNHQFTVPYVYPDQSRVFTSAPYEIRHIVGKGKGVFATSTIPRGKIVMVDHAVMLAPMTEVFQDDQHLVADEEATRLFEVAADQLPNPEKLLSLAKSDFYGLISPVQNVFETNSYTVSVDQQDFNAIFLEVSRLNHACNPNCRAEWSEDHLAFIIWTLRNIEPGEELTMTYIPMGPDWTWQKRQETLSAGWHFKCKCALCSASGDFIKASDQRRRKFGTLAQICQRREKSGNYAGAIELVEKLLEINRQEPMLTSPVQLYLAAARVARRGDDSRATMYTQLAKNEMRDRGFKNEDEIREMRTLDQSFGGLDIEY